MKTYFILALSLMSFIPDVHAKQDLRQLVMQLTQEIHSLQSQVAQSNARIDDLEQQLKQSVVHSEITADNKNDVSIKPSHVTDHPSQPVKAPVTEGDFKGSFKVPATNTSIGLGGFVKLDTLFSSVSMGKDKFGNQRLEVSEIPVGTVPAADNDQISFHAKESRFWFRSFTPSQW